MKRAQKSILISKGGYPGRTTRAYLPAMFFLLFMCLFGRSLYGQLPTYSQVATLNYKSENVYYAILGDLNGDGLTDVVGCFKGSTQADLVVWYQTPAHTFPTGTHLGSINACALMAVGDVNHDNIPDIVTTDQNGNYYGFVSLSGSYSPILGKWNCTPPGSELYIANDQVFGPECGIHIWDGRTGLTLSDNSVSMPTFPNGGFILGPQLQSSSPYSYIGAFDGGFEVSGFSVKAGSGATGYNFSTESNYGPGAMPDWFNYWNLQMRAPVAPFWACVPVEINIDGSVACISYGESTNNTQSGNYNIYYIVDSGPQLSNTAGSTPVALPGYSFGVLPSPSTYVNGGAGGGPARGLFNVFPWNLGNGPDDFVVANADGNLYAALHNGTGSWASPQLLVNIPKGQYIFDVRSGGTDLPQFFLTSDAMQPNPTASPLLYGTNVHVWTAPPLSRPTSTTVATSNPSIYATASVTFTANVSVTSGTPTGNVTFYADGNSIGSANLSGGSASISTSSLSIGTHSITASYSPSGAFLASSSSPISQTITRMPTGLNVNINPSPGFVTQNVGVAVSVSAANGGTPTGLVSVVADGGNNLGSPTLSGGAAAVGTSGLSLGSHQISISYSGDSTYDNSSTIQTEVINQIPTATSLSLSGSTVTYNTNVIFTARVSSPYGTPTGTVTFLAGATPIGTATLNGSGVATITNNTLDANTYTITARYGGTTNFATSNGTANLTVHLAPVSINWNTPTAIIYGTPLSGTQLDAVAVSNGVSVSGTYVYTPTSGAILGAGMHNLSVSFTPFDTADYTTAVRTVQLQVNKANPIITWNTPVPITYETPLSTLQLDATANVPGSLVYSPKAGTVLGAGSQALSVSFTPTDTADYNNASATVQLQVNKANPVITWNTPAPITYGTPLSGTQLDATANVPGSFAYTPASGNVLHAGNQTLNAAFTPTDTADYNNVSATVQLQVNKANPVITWNTPAPITYGAPLNSIQLNATANVPGSLVYSPASGEVPRAGIQTLNVAFTPTDPTDYNDTTAMVQLQVNKANPRIHWANPAAINYGTALSGIQLNASAGNLQGSFDYAPGAGTALNAGIRTLSTIFTPSDSTDYTAASAEVQIQVNKLIPTITWPNPAPITYGTALSSTQLDASAGNVAGTMVYSPSSSTILNAGLRQLSVSFTPTDTVDYATASDSVPLSVNKATPTLSIITSGSPSNYKSAVTFTATISNGPSGTVTFFDGAVAIGTAVLSNNAASITTSSLTVGTHSVTAKWDGNANYNPVVSAPVMQVVKDIRPTLTWNNPSDIVYGTPLSGVQLNATASTTGTFVYSPSMGTILTAGRQQLSVIFTPTDSADYATETASVTIVVDKATPIINWTIPAAIPAGTPLGSTQLDATANVPGSFTYNPGIGEVLQVGTQPLNVNFTPADTVDYTTASDTVPQNVVSFTITAGAQAIPNATSTASAMATTDPKADNMTVSFGSGQPFNVPLKLTPLSGFAGPISLSCEGIPETMGCTFADPTVNISSGPVTTNLTITTQGRSVTYSAALFLGLFTLGLGFHRKVRKNLAIYCLLALIGSGTVLTGLVGCGGVNYTQFDGTPKGTYTIIVKAMSNSIVNSVKVTVTVQ